MKRSLSALARVLRAILLAPIVGYQRFVSPALPRRCKYYPTCSAYAVEAIREVGPVRGSILAAWRLLRCNPFSYGGYDPLKNRRFFKESIPLESSAPARPQTRSNRTRERGNGVPAVTAPRRTRERASVIAGDSNRERAGAEHAAR